MSDVQMERITDRLDYLTDPDGQQALPKPAGDHTIDEI